MSEKHDTHNVRDVNPDSPFHPLSMSEEDWKKDGNIDWWAIKLGKSPKAIRRIMAERGVEYGRFGEDIWINGMDLRAAMGRMTAATDPRAKHGGKRTSEE